jgi:hypothetical protein
MTLFIVLPNARLTDGCPSVSPEPKDGVAEATTLSIFVYKEEKVNTKTVEKLGMNERWLSA